MDSNRKVRSIIIGIVLLVLGVLSLFGNILGALNMDNLWPLILVGIGVAFFIALALGDKSLAGLAVPGSILVTVGLLLYIMNYTDTWEAWSYCWALIIVASGAGVWINGLRSDRPELRKRGADTIRSGLVLFFVFAVIMELIFTISGEHRLVNPIVWAILLAGLGLILLVVRILRMGKPGGEHADLFWPIIMIGVGLAAIFYQLGYISTANLWRLLSLWPVLLIVIGVSILLHSRSPWVGAVLGLLVVAGILVVGFSGEQLGLPTQPAWLSEFGDIEFGDVNAQQILGSGKQISENRPVSGVSRVELSIPADLEIQQGAIEELTVKADENIMPVLMTAVSGGKLSIRYQPGVDVRPSHRPQISLTVKDLSDLKVSSSGSVKAGSITTGDFDLSLTSSGDINIQGLQADEITADLTSSGDILIQGKANQLNLDVTSSGTFQAGDLEVQEADVNLTSSGEVTLWVVNDLRAKISSSGNIAYYGNPSVHQTLTSSGNLIPKGNK